MLVYDMESFNWVKRTHAQFPLLFWVGDMDMHDDISVEGVCVFCVVCYLGYDELLYTYVNWHYSCCDYSIITSMSSQQLHVSICINNQQVYMSHKWLMSVLPKVIEFSMT